MNYNQSIDYITKKQSLGIKPGLNRIISLLDKMDNPQNKLRIIHIAGTNGKGTVAATIAEALSKNGYKVGLFTSPWVINYREQIQIDGRFISETEFSEYITAWKDESCTEFELLTAIMYKYFADNNVDYAVVECGMGGKGDCTNVEKDNISVITSISVDHTSFLGKTIDEIAEEKSSILRKDSVCFLYDDNLKAHFEGKCKKLYTGGLNDNLALVNAVLSYLYISNANQLKQLPARCERKKGILLDGGHNLDAAKFLSDKIDNEIAVIGMMKDKDVDGYLSIIAPKCKRIICVDVNNTRAISKDELKKLAEKYCNCVETAESCNDAINIEPTLICGSFYLMREIINLI